MPGWGSFSGPNDQEATAESAEARGFSTLANQVMERFQYHEDRIQQSFAKGLEPNGELTGLPDYVKQQFKRWDEEFTRPEDLALVRVLKQKVQALHESNVNYIRDQVRVKSDSLRLETAMKAVSKTTQGIQQLLSSQ